MSTAPRDKKLRNLSMSSNATLLRRMSTRHTSKPTIDEESFNPNDLSELSTLYDTMDERNSNNEDSNREDIVDALKRIAHSGDWQHIYKDLQPDDIEGLTDVLAIIELKDGETVFPLGEEATYVVFVIEGEVILEDGDDTTTTTTKIPLTTGAVLGATGFFLDGAERAYSAKTKTESTIAILRYKTLSSLAADPQNAPLVAKITDIMARSAITVGRMTTTTKRTTRVGPYPHVREGVAPGEKGKSVHMETLFKLRGKSIQPKKRPQKVKPLQSPRKVRSKGRSITLTRDREQLEAKLEQQQRSLDALKKNVKQQDSEISAMRTQHELALTEEKAKHKRVLQDSEGQFKRGVELVQAHEEHLSTLNYEQLSAMLEADRKLQLKSKEHQELELKSRGKANELVKMRTRLDALKTLKRDKLVRMFTEATHRAMSRTRLEQELSRGLTDRNFMKKELSNSQDQERQLYMKLVTAKRDAKEAALDHAKSYADVQDDLRDKSLHFVLERTKKHKYEQILRIMSVKRLVKSVRAKRCMFSSLEMMSGVMDSLYEHYNQFFTHGQSEGITLRSQEEIDQLRFSVKARHRKIQAGRRNHNINFLADTLSGEVDELVKLVSSAMTGWVAWRKLSQTFAQQNLELGREVKEVRGELQGYEDKIESVKRERDIFKADYDERHSEKLRELEKTWRSKDNKDMTIAEKRTLDQEKEMQAIEQKLRLVKKIKATAEKENKSIITQKRKLKKEVRDLQKQVDEMIAFKKNVTKSLQNLSKGTSGSKQGRSTSPAKNGGPQSSRSGARTARVARSNKPPSKGSRLNASTPRPRLTRLQSIRAKARREARENSETGPRSKRRKGWVGISKPRKPPPPRLKSFLRDPSLQVLHMNVQKAQEERSVWRKKTPQQRRGGRPLHMRFPGAKKPVRPAYTPTGSKVLRRQAKEGPKPEILLRVGVFGDVPDTVSPYA